MQRFDYEMMQVHPCVVRVGVATARSAAQFGAGIT